MLGVTYLELIALVHILNKISLIQVKPKVDLRFFSLHFHPQEQIDCDQMIRHYCSSILLGLYVFTQYIANNTNVYIRNGY